MTIVRIIGVPLDLGASRRGVDMGPFAVRYTDLRSRLEAIGHTVEDAGNVRVPFREDVDPGGKLGPRYLGAITAVCRDVAAETRTALARSAVPLLIGGDHSLSGGSIAGAAAHFAERGERIGVIWLDAHGDLHTPVSSHSGNVHGMPMAHLLGHGDPVFANVAGVKPALRAENVALVGIRELDEPEREHARDWGLHVQTIRALDERGIRAVMEDAIATATRGTAGIWVSFDMDCVTPEDAPGVGTAVPGGLTYREAHLAMEMLADTGKVIGIDLVEVNPVLDERNRTAEVAAELLLSALGKRIL